MSACIDMNWGSTPNPSRDNPNPDISFLRVCRRYKIPMGSPPGLKHRLGIKICVVTEIIHLVSLRCDNWCRRCSEFC